MKIQTIIKVGNSLAVTIPSRVARTLGIKHQDKVMAKIDLEDGSITYRFQGSHQLPLVPKSKKS
jgi:antitoxin component of MazEF toxin-antitoxin module